jgi:subtilisin family serine protease
LAGSCTLPLQPVDAQEAEAAADEGASAPDWLTDLDVDASSFRLIRDAQARRTYGVSGAGLAVAIVDSGANGGHPAIEHAVLPGRNFSSGGSEQDTNDVFGSGSHRAGVIAARDDQGVPEGVAPGAKIVPVKVFDEGGSASVENIVRALEWIADPQTRDRYQQEHRVTLSAVCLGIGVGENFTDVASVPERFQPIRQAINKLVASGIIVCAPAGNNFANEEGMAFPAICPETISVGTVYDANIKPQQDEVLIEYAGGINVFGMRRDQIAAFSQRLCPDSTPNKRGTDVFAPGVSILSVGSHREDKPLIQSGTAVSTAFVSGAVLLLQERSRTLTARVSKGEPQWLPDPELVRRCLYQGSVVIQDAGDESEPLDNVQHTDHTYRRLDLVGAIRALNQNYQGDVIRLRQMLLRDAAAKKGDNGAESVARPAFEKRSYILGKEVDTSQQ